MTPPPDAGPPGDWCRWDGADLVLDIRVVPRARQTAIAGVRHGRLLVRLQAPPVEGRANAAIERAFARWCGVARGAVAIESGHRGRDKRVRITAPATLPLQPRAGDT